ncbi:MAG: YHS domain-containing protein [Pseudomonadota bacterium]
MNTHSLRLAIAITAGLIPNLAWAQHDAHQAASAQAPSAELTQCVRVQPVIDNIITAATARAEAARLSNSPTDMRAAVEHLEAALRDIRAQSAPCATAAASSAPHAGHPMPGTQPPTAPAPVQPPAATDPHAGHMMPSAAAPSKGATAAKPAPRTPPKPAASDPHAGHTASGAAPAAKAASRTKPAAAKPADSKAADPHAAHSAGQPGDKQRDPVNGLMVDPATAPKTTYQGNTYYFSSEQSRKEFLASPAKFAKKPKG